MLSYALTNELDYLHLTCGLAWVFFASLIRFGAWRRDDPLASRCFVAAAVLLAGWPWLQVASASFELSGAPDLLDLIFYIAPLVVLLHAVRRGSAGPGAWWSGRWLYGPLAALTLLAQGPALGWRFTAAMAPAAWLAAIGMGWLILRPLPEPAAPSRSRRVAAWALVIYLASLAWPWFPPETAEAATALVILGRTVAAWVFLGAATVHYHRSTLPRKPIAGWGLWRISAGGWLLLAWAGVLVGGGALTELAARNREGTLRHDLTSRAQLAVAALDLNLLPALSASTNDLARPEYHQLKQRLTALRQANADCRFVYLIKLRPDHALFFADSEPPESKDYSPPGEVDEASPAALASLRRGEVRVTGMVRDRWGIWVSSFVPIGAAPGRDPLAVLGYDVDARHWGRQIAQARLVPVTGTLLLSLLLLSISIGYQKATTGAAQLTASEQRYRQMFESNPAIMLLLDPQAGEVLAANPAAAAFYHFPPGETRRRKVWEFCTEPADEVARQIRAMAAGELGFLSTRHLVAPGTHRDVEVFAGPVDTGEGRVLNWIIQDVTERRRAEADLRHRETVLAGVAAAGQVLLSGADPDASVAQALEALGRAMRADRAYVFECHPHPLTGAPVASQRFEWTNGRVSAELDNPALQNHDFNRIFPTWGALLSRGQPVEALVSQLDAEARQLLDAQHIQSLLVFPIQVQERFWGFIGFDDCQTARHWNRAETDALRAMAGPIGNAIIRARDAAALRQREQQLRAADRLQNTIINTAVAATFTVDAAGRITSVNEAFCAATGWDPDSIIGQSAAVLEVGGDQAAAPVTPAMLGRLSRRQQTLRTRDGSERIVIKNAEPIANEPGEIVGGVQSFVDVTDLIAAREEVERTNGELRLLNESLQVAAREASAASAAKSDFLANMSHEIRTPMNAVLGMSSLLLDSPLTSRQLEFVEAIRTSGDALLEIINEILDFSKIESSKLKLEPGNFDLRGLVDSVIELLAPRALEKRLELAVIVPSETPRGLRGDDGRLRQVLVNLVGNGIKFTERGEVTLRVQCLSRHRNGAWLRFAVTDTGIGIPAEMQSRLFQPFSQVDATAARRYSGTGLGLAISKRLIELMGGRIGVDSTPGAGSTFWFEVELEFAPTPEDPPLLNNLAEARVLIVDRHASTRESLWTMLESWRLAWFEAADGATALALLHAHTARASEPCILLIDQELPDGSGLDFAQRAVAIAPATRVVLLTPLDAKPPANPFPGLAGHLAKPVKRSQLFNLLLAAVAGPGGRSAGDTEFTRKPVAPTVALPPHLRILVAEDHDINRRLAMLILERLGCRADFASDGQEALEAWERFPYDVILMDCQMPRLDGYDTAREIRRREAARAAETPAHVHIIAMTAHALVGDREKCLAAGMDDYLSKPIRLEALQDALRHVAPAHPKTAPLPPGPPDASPAPVFVPPDADPLTDLVADLGVPATIELVESFFSDTPPRLAEVKALAGGEDPATLARAVHSLAGSFGYFGLQPLRMRALQLEQQVRAGNNTDMTEGIRELETGFAAARPWLESRLARLKAGA